MEALSPVSRFFTDAQRELLAAVLNRIVPGEGLLPGAGDLGLVEFLEGVVGSDLQLRRRFNDGLAQIAIAASHLVGQEFPQLAEEAQYGILRRVQAGHPEFFEALVRQTYNGYYTNPRVFELLGYSPPQAPAEGYQPELLDQSLLEKQRQRAPFWRRA